MSLALETICEKFGMKLTEDPATRVVALKIIELAQRGVQSRGILPTMTSAKAGCTQNNASTDQSAAKSAPLKILIIIRHPRGELYAAQDALTRAICDLLRTKQYGPAYNFGYRRPKSCSVLMRQTVPGSAVGKVPRRRSGRLNQTDDEPAQPQSGLPTAAR